MRAHAHTHTCVFSERTFLVDKSAVLFQDELSIELNITSTTDPGGLISHSLSLSHTHTHTHIHTQSHAQIHLHTNTHTHTMSITHNHTHSHTHTHTHTHTQCPYLVVPSLM